MVHWKNFAFFFFLRPFTIVYLSKIGLCFFWSKMASFELLWALVSFSENNGVFSSINGRNISKEIYLRLDQRGHLTLLFPGLRNEWVEETAHTSSSPWENPLSWSQLLVPPLPIEIAAGMGSFLGLKTPGWLRFERKVRGVELIDSLGQPASV